MDLINIGKIVNTHGLKGEVRILSSFKYKTDVFKLGSGIYINNVYYEILSYRHHKIYDMVTLTNINSIDDAINIKGLDVYINRDDYTFKGYLDEDLIGLDVYDGDEYKGTVKKIKESPRYSLLVIEGVKKHLVPNIPEFIQKVDIENNRIFINYIKGLDCED